MWSIDIDLFSLNSADCDGTEWVCQQVILGILIWPLLHSGGFLGLLVIITKIQKLFYLLLHRDICDFLIVIFEVQPLDGELVVAIRLPLLSWLLFPPFNWALNAPSEIKAAFSFCFFSYPRPPCDYRWIDPNLTPCKIKSRKKYTGAAKVLSSPFRLLVFYMGSGERMQIIVTM